MISLLTKRGYISLILCGLIVGLGIILYTKVEIVVPEHASLSLEISNKSATRNLAASLLISPSTGNYDVGDTVSVVMLVNTANNAVNAVSGKITFPQDKLEVQSISKKDSVIGLWIEGPTYSNDNGTITLSGITPSTSFNTSAGQIITVVFKITHEGNALLEIKEGLVLAGDGQGTNLLTDTMSSNFNFAQQKNSAGIYDLNNDNKIDISDVSILISNWGTPKNQRADFDKDGIVDLRDLSILVTKFPKK